MQNSVLALAFCSGLLFVQTAQNQDIEPVNFSDVEISDRFWAPRIRTVSNVTIPVCIEQTEVKTSRIRNFEKAARKAGEKHEGIYYDDSDVYKALEAIAYSLKNHPAPRLESKADEWIAKIAAAQEPDGYLNTYYTLTGLENRWTDMDKHEAYCAGHLIEAGIAYFDATGKRDLLDVGIRMADHMMSVFGPGKKHWVTGHQEVELALVKLAETTGEEKYLQFADWLLNERGQGYGKGAIWENERWGRATHCQDDVPLQELEHISGHAVRAMYYYAGAVDVAARKQKPSYMKAMDRVWEDVVHRNMYVTGAIGSSGHNEGFTQAYDLPNASAYGETCASVGMVFWNQRMFQATGNSKYIDVLERSLYNGALAGISLDGDRFFYPNPLASEGDERKEWFGTACCPSNIARLLTSLGNYVYATNRQDIWVNLFVEGNGQIRLQKGNVELVQETGYPRSGEVRITLNPENRAAFDLHIRIPGWARGEAVPGGLYQFANRPETKPVLKINGEAVDYRMDKGYAVISRKWKKGDEVAVSLPMEVRQVKADPQIEQDQDRVAIQRGPLVYCVEGADNDQEVFNLLLSAQSTFNTVWQPDLLGGVILIEASGKAVIPAENDQDIRLQDKTIRAIPYYAWANRGKSPMQVWIPNRIRSVVINDPLRN